MAQVINAPLNVQFQNGTQLTRQIQSSVNGVQFNFGGAKGLRSLSQPLGRLTGQADEFTKSLDAANARVLAFGASVGVVNAVSNAFKSLVSSTIEVEKAITAISVVGEQFNGKTKELSQGLFNIAKNTGQSFAEVSKAALEFARQGEGLEETLKRTNDALILTRATGLDAAKSVEGISAAVSAFAKAGLTTAQVINKLAAVDKAFKVSSADLIQAFERTGAVAQQAGVSFDELAGIVTALQNDTSRGGAVIGNALKTIFSRLQDTSTLTQLQDLGVAVQDLQGNILPARQILQNLAGDVQGLSKVTQAGIFKDVAGTFQLNQLVSLVNDLNKAKSVSAAATKISTGATNEAYVANEKLNQSLDALLNKVAITGKQLGSLLGEIGLTDNLKGLLDGVNSFLEDVNGVLQGGDIGSNFAKGFVKGIGAVLSGPGLGVFLAIIAKLSYDLLRFGTESLKTFFGIGKAANDQKQIQESIVQVLLRNSSVLKDIENTQGGINAQAARFVTILNQELQAIQKVQSLAGNLTGAVYSAGYRQTEKGLQKTRGKAAGGYLPAQEAADVRRGVGGASPNSKVVAIPNFAFGGGKRGTMIANTSEYIVPNYAGGGSAIFNQDMVKTMGLPAGAKKIGAAGGFIPNFKNPKNIETINEGKFFEKKLNSKLFGNESYSPNEALDFPLPIGFGANDEAKKNLNISSLSKYGDAKRSFNRKNSVSLIDKYLRTSEGKRDFLTSRIDKDGFVKLNPDGLSMLFLYGNENLSSTIYAGTKNQSFSVSSKALIDSRLSRTKNPNLSRTIKMPLIADKVNSDFLTASSGYVPNFANYIYDSDKIPSAQRERILQSILSSNKRKNLLVGPAGSGKSTAAAGLGTFIKSLDDLRMASSFTILSSSGLSSKGGFTESFQNILSAVNRSGGKTTYLGATNKELMRRRGSRTLSEGDVRSAGELSGTAYAPLNQSAFIKQLKKESGDFQLQKSAKSSFSNDQLAVLGLYGQTGGNIDGSKIYTLSSQQPNITRDIKKEYEARVKTFVRSYSQELANKIGIKRSPKEVKKSIQQSDSVSGFIFEDVLNQLAGKEFDTSSLSGGARVDFKMTPNLRAVFGTGSETFAEAKLNPYTNDAQSSVRSKQAAMLSGAASLPKQQSSSSFSQLRQRWINYKNRANKKGGFNEFQDLLRATGIKGVGKDTQNKQLDRYFGTAAAGYIPNFAASALQQAIAREKSAGLSDSQIYVDQSPSLKSPLNPMGLMVANTRDEPFGGIQGISRARNEGANPKTYGAANGFVPNYASQQTGATSPNVAKVEKGFGDLAGKFIILQSALSFFQGGFTEAGSVAEKFSSGLQTAVSAIFAYQAIQQLSSKNQNQQIQTNTSLLKKASDGLKKFASDFEKGGGARAATVARGGKLPSSTPFATRFSAGLGTGKIAGGVRSFVGNPLGAIQSLGATALTATIALKSFNDIASLFYTKSPKVAQSLDLLSSAAMEASQSLTSVDKSEITSGLTTLKNQSVGTWISGLINTINPLRVGRESVSYSSDINNIQNAVLAGGQTQEDFAKAQSDLMTLFYSNLKASMPNEPSSSLKEMAKNEVYNAIEAATETGLSGLKEINLEKIFDLSNVKELISKSKETAKKLQISASNIEFEKPLEVFKRTIEKLIFDGAQVIENASQDLQRTSKIINAITSSKSFATLGDSSKIAFEINSSLEQFNAEYNNKIQKLLNETQSTLAGYLPELGISKDREEPIQSVIKAVGQATTKEGLDTALKDFVSQIKFAGVALDNAKFNELENKVKSSTNAFSNLIKEQDAELTILQLNNQEKLLEAQAYDTYRNNLAGFVEQTVKSAKSIAALRGEIERIAITQESNITARTAVSKTGREDVIIRGEEELKAFRDRRDKETAILFEEQAMAAKQQFFTKENIAELNRNTEALNDLRMVLAQDFINKIDDSIKVVQDMANATGPSLFQGASAPLSTGITLPSGINNAQDALNYLQNLKRAYSPAAPGLNTGVNLTTAEADLNKITAAIRGGSSFADVQAQINTLSKNEVYVNQLTEYAKKMYEAAQTSAATMEENETTLKEQVKANIRNYDIINSYGTKLNNSLKSVRDSLTDPQTRGELLSKLGVIRRGEKEQGLGTEAEKRNYRSSFGYGFDEAMDKLRARTEDFRNQLGQEIPDLFSQNLAQGLNDAISGAKSLKEALTDAATSFFQEITRKNISNLADLATRGLGSLAQTGFGALGFASGGLIKGGSGTKDDVPAMLMGGEYVVKKSAVNKYGKGFLDAINSGNMRGYATGGMVDPQTFPAQTGRGGFFTPGDYGQGAITGKNELLTFATQSFTGGQYDYMGGFGMGGATVSLEPESARLSALGREGSPMFERVQQSKDEAFKVYLEGLQKEKEYADLLDQIAQNEKARKKQLQTAIISAVVSSVASYAGSAFSAGASNAAGAAKAAGAGVGGQMWAGLKGGFGFGGATGQGGLGNLFSGSGKAFTNLGQIAQAQGVKPQYNFDTNKQLRGVTIGNTTYLGGNYFKNMGAFGSMSMPLASTPSKAITSMSRMPSQASHLRVSNNTSALALPTYTSGSSSTPMLLPLLPQRTAGGLISGGSNIRDDVPAMLTGGEFVLNNRATQRIGLQNLNKLNSGAPISSEGASTEMTQALISKLDELIQTTANSSKENVVVNVSTNEAGGQTAENPAGAEKELHKKIRQAVLDVIAQEKRLGGSLEKSR